MTKAIMKARFKKASPKTDKNKSGTYSDKEAVIKLSDR